jgi:hypothetical protein
LDVHIFTPQLVKSIQRQDDFAASVSGFDQPVRLIRPLQRERLPNEQTQLPLDNQLDQFGKAGGGALEANVGKTELCIEFGSAE